MTTMGLIPNSERGEIITRKREKQARISFRRFPCTDEHLPRAFRKLPDNIRQQPPGISTRSTYSLPAPTHDRLVAQPDWH